jgi:hypothetical protein
LRRQRNIRYDGAVRFNDIESELSV